jgi:tripartite-type tricarboxylate transporter receptor subunit TctC
VPARLEMWNFDAAKPGRSTPQALHEWVRSELARWTKVVRDAGIQGPGTETR